MLRLHLPIHSIHNSEKNIFTSFSRILQQIQPMADFQRGLKDMEETTDDALGCSCKALHKMSLSHWERRSDDWALSEIGRNRGDCGVFHNRHPGHWFEVTWDQFTVMPGHGSQEAGWRRGCDTKGDCASPSFVLGTRKLFFFPVPIAQIASVIALNNFRCSLPLGYLTEIIDCCTSLSVTVFWQQGSGNTLLDPLDGANGSAWRETRAGRMFSGRTGSVFIPPVVKARWCFFRGFCSCYRTVLLSSHSCVDFNVLFAWLCLPHICIFFFSFINVSFFSFQSLFLCTSKGHKVAYFLLYPLITYLL